MEHIICCILFPTFSSSCYHMSNIIWSMSRGESSGRHFRFIENNDWNNDSHNHFANDIKFKLKMKFKWKFQSQKFHKLGTHFEHYLTVTSQNLNDKISGQFWTPPEHFENFTLSTRTPPMESWSINLLFWFSLS